MRTIISKHKVLYSRDIRSFLGVMAKSPAPRSV